MRVVIQRVQQASVSINGKVHSAIQDGMLVLVGIEAADTLEDVKWLSTKIVNLRIFNDTEGVMNVSLKETQGELLLVSQFTLHASTQKGNRPSYIKAARPEIAIPIYHQFIEQLQLDLDKPISTGVFGANMQVMLINDGPVTILMDSKNKE
jgi:D-aminoacyl-tRNA deacylase